jgi:hypothetical protein
MKFKVSVEKNYYVTGAITVEAEDSDAALKQVSDRINEGNLQTSDSDIEWNDDLDYIDGSFQTTGDIEEEE